jgi:hypothetical protein
MLCQLFFSRQVGDNFEYVVRWWISEDKNYVLNIFSSAVLWTLCSTRNDVEKSGQCQRDVGKIGCADSELEKPLPRQAFEFAGCQSAVVGSSQGRAVEDSLDMKVLLMGAMLKAGSWCRSNAAMAPGFGLRKARR